MALGGWSQSFDGLSVAKRRLSTVLRGKPIVDLGDEFPNGHKEVIRDVHPGNGGGAKTAGVILVDDRLIDAFCAKYLSDNSSVKVHLICRVASRFQRSGGSGSSFGRLVT